VLFKEEKRKISSTEAGFDNNKKSRQGGYSIQFVIILFIFIAFDLELLFIRRVLIKVEVNMIILFLVFIILTFVLE